MPAKALNNVLLIEDNLGDARLLREMMSSEHGSPSTDLSHVETMAEADAYLAGRTVDVIVLDLGLPDVQGLGAVRRAHAAAPRIPLVVLTGTDDDALGVRVLQEGAQDYLVKNHLEARSLLRSLRYAMERKVLEEAAFEEKERAQLTLDCIADAVICTNVTGHITLLNAVAERMTGWSRGEAAGRPMSDVFRIVDGVSRQAITIPVGPTPGRRRATPLRSNSVLVRRDGSEVPIDDSVASIHARGGQSTGMVVVFRDVSAARTASLEMLHSAKHDFLTGLPNRMLMNDRVGHAIALAKRRRKQVAVLFLDLDGFKHINDSLGHSAGDKLLQSIAKRLVDCGRASDTVSRQGGDEFIVLLSEIEHSEDAAIAAGRMLAAVAVPHSIDQHEVHVTTSIGVSVYPDDGSNAETLIKNADTAMYQAKMSGRETFRYFMPAMNARAYERQCLEDDLRRALEQQEFTLDYQPKVDTRSGAIMGVEAFIRWTHPTRGSVTPAEFLPIAEGCGLMVPIGRWVLRQACAQAQAWLKADLATGTMAVNVSAPEFRSDGFLQNLFATLSETGLDPRLLELDVTERVLMKHADSAASTLRALHGQGVQVALDNFGTGYSSLSHLRMFPLDILKIDQSLVGQITTTDDGGSVVTGVIRLAECLKLRVVAEGVETREQLAFLRSQACHEAQGYYFSRPLQASQIAQVVTTGIH